MNYDAKKKKEERIYKKKDNSKNPLETQKNRRKEKHKKHRRVNQFIKSVAVMKGFAKKSLKAKHGR